MSGELPERRKTELALAIAQGVSVSAWARENQVPRAKVSEFTGLEVRMTEIEEKLRERTGNTGCPR